MCTDGGGIFTSGMLLAQGRTKRHIAASAERGDIVRIGRGVYATPGACEARRTAAAHGGALACVSAARHLGLWVLDEIGPPHVWLGGGGHVRKHPGCRCTTHWDDAVRNTAGALSVPRVLLQILRCRGIEEFFVTLESARRLRRVTPSGLAWLRTQVGAAGRSAMDLAQDDADSGLESLVRWRLRDRAVSIRTQVGVVSVGRVDIVIGERLIVEVDGAPHHDGPSHRHRDLVRDAHAAAWGFVTLRFDYAMVVHDWETVELAILAYLDRGIHLAS